MGIAGKMRAGEVPIACAATLNKTNCEKADTKPAQAMDGANVSNIRISLFSRRLSYTATRRLLAWVSGRRPLSHVSMGACGNEPGTAIASLQAALF